MKVTLKYIIIFLSICTLISEKVEAQDNEWNSDTLDNGQITVRYRFNHYTDVSGKDSLIIEDETTLIESMSFSKCIELMNDVSMHKEFSGDKESVKIRDISNSECIVYYYTRNPWPIKNSDCVAKMNSMLDTINRVATFTFSAASGEYLMGDVNRMTQYDVVYTYMELTEGKVKLTIKGRTSPPVKVPFWIIKSAFPGAPAKAIRKIAELTKD